MTTPRYVTPKALLAWLDIHSFTDNPLGHANIFYPSTIGWWIEDDLVHSPEGRVTADRLLQLQYDSEVWNLAGIESQADIEPEEEVWDLAGAFGYTGTDYSNIPF
jgi:hypothetical protein